jgi:fructose-1,6-bisphosphatase/inositol monophosphatase family enzyme
MPTPQRKTRFHQIKNDFVTRSTSFRLPRPTLGATNEDIIVSDSEFLDEVLQVARDALHEAANVVTRAWGTGVGRSDVDYTKSGSADLVTITDQECEQIISRKIRSKFPNHVIIGEEAAGGDRYNLTNAPTWTIDPVDGTTNFVHRWPWTALLLSFIVDQQVVVAVTYDAINDELYWAKKGSGAFVSSPRYTGPIRVSGTDTLDKAVVIMEVGYGRDDASITRITNSLAGLMRRNVRSVRMAGSCGLNMAAVASGKVDAFFEEGEWGSAAGIKIWDFAGGKLLIEEAGGVILDPSSGQKFDLLGRSVLVASSQALAVQILEVLKEARS